jgi:uncharacterized damage-inducible protein DinB
MTYGTADQYRRWFDYEKDSHVKVLASLNAVPTDKRSSEAFQKAVMLMAHLVEARKLWLRRIGVGKERTKDLFPKDVPLPELAQRVEAIQADWSAYLARMDEPELVRVFEYGSTEGPRFRNTIEDILAQLFGHSLYHRGQIAALLRSVGAEPAATDFVFWAREPVTPAK